MRATRWILAIWFCFLVRAFFYCAALPLWEGYDEWSHFATVQRMASRTRLPQARMTLLAEALRAKGLVDSDRDARGQPAWRLTEAGITHVQRRTRHLLAPEPRGPVRSDRVWRVLGHLADHGPSRTRDIAAALGVPFQPMNALIQQLKRRGMVCKAGDDQLSPHGITEFGRSVLAGLIGQLPARLDLLERARGRAPVGRADRDEIPLADNCHVDDRAGAVELDRDQPGPIGRRSKDAAVQHPRALEVGRKPLRACHLRARGGSRDRSSQVAPVRRRQQRDIP